MCIGTDAANITNLTQKGADAATFADQVYMGFSFNLTEAAGNLAAGYHPYYIGQTPTTPPTAPTALSAYIPSLATPNVLMSFTQPWGWPYHAGIGSYEYELDDSGTWITVDIGATPEWIITGLTYGTAYSIKLRAVNSAGPGTESAAVTATTPSPA